MKGSPGSKTGSTPDSPNSKTTSTPDSPNSRDDIDARFTKLEENQHDIAQTLAVLVALVKANSQGEAITRAETVPAGHHGATA